MVSGHGGLSTATFNVSCHTTHINIDDEAVETTPTITCPVNGGDFLPSGCYPRGLCSTMTDCGEGWLANADVGTPPCGGSLCHETYGQST